MPLKVPKKKVETIESTLFCILRYALFLDLEPASKSMSFYGATKMRMFLEWLQMRKISQDEKLYLLRVISHQRRRIPLPVGCPLDEKYRNGCFEVNINHTHLHKPLCHCFIVKDIVCTPMYSKRRQIIIVFDRFFHAMHGPDR